MEWKGVGIEQEQERLQCSKQEQGRRERRLLPQTSGGESIRSNLMYGSSSSSRVGSCVDVDK